MNPNRVHLSLHLHADKTTISADCQPNGIASDPRPYASVTLSETAFSWGIYSHSVTDFNRFIDALTAARDRLAEAQRAQRVREEADDVAFAEAAARQMTCDNCDHTGTDANPLVPVEGTAAHPEGYVHAEGCPEMPHAEDAHADHADHAPAG